MIVQVKSVDEWRLIVKNALHEMLDHNTIYLLNYNCNSLERYWSFASLYMRYIIENDRPELFLVFNDNYNHITILDLYKFLKELYNYISKSKVSYSDHKNKNHIKWSEFHDIVHSLLYGLNMTNELKKVNKYHF
jgi:hypothetical protein